MHLTQMPRALASGMAQTGRGRPHRGQSTGARSAPEAGRKGFVAVLQGDNATASFPQSSGQREAFLQLGTPLPLFALKLREVSSPESMIFTSWVSSGRFDMRALNRHQWSLARVRSMQ